MLPLPDGRVILALGDVAGKGSPAALLMALLLAVLRTLVDEELEPEALTERLNTQIWRHSPASRFITIFYAVYTPVDGALDLRQRRTEPAADPASGRHASNGSRRRASRSGCSIGPRTRRATTRIEPGELLVLYSDGITEAEDPAASRSKKPGLQAVVDSLPATRRRRELGAADHQGRRALRAGVAVRRRPDDPDPQAPRARLNGVSRPSAELTAAKIDGERRRRLQSTHRHRVAERFGDSQRRSDVRNAYDPRLRRVEDGERRVAGGAQATTRAVERRAIEQVPAQGRAARVVAEAAAVLHGEHECGSRQPIADERADRRILALPLAQARKARRRRSGARTRATTATISTTAAAMPMRRRIASAQTAVTTGAKISISGNSRAAGSACRTIPRAGSTRREDRRGRPRRTKP